MDKYHIPEPTKVESSYEDGISTVTIYTPCGKFTGIARLHPGDADKASRFAGCDYAYWRANAKYYKALARTERALKEDYIHTQEWILLNDNNCSHRTMWRLRQDIDYHAHNEKMLLDAAAAVEDHIKEDQKLRAK